MKADRYWAKDTQGEDIEVVDYFDDNGKFITGKLLRIKNEIRTGAKEYRTKSYYAERVINPASKVHNNYKETAIAKDIANVRKRRS